MTLFVYSVRKALNMQANYNLWRPSYVCTVTVPAIKGNSSYKSGTVLSFENNFAMTCTGIFVYNTIMPYQRQRLHRIRRQRLCRHLHKTWIFHPKNKTRMSNVERTVTLWSVWWLDAIDVYLFGRTTSTFCHWHYLRCRKTIILCTIYHIICKTDIYFEQRTEAVMNGTMSTCYN